VNNKTIGERFTDALAFIYKGSSNHIRSCVEDTGISQPSISRAKKAIKITPSILKIAKQKKISLKWLLNGEGEMIQSFENDFKENKVEKEPLAPDILNIVDMLQDIDKIERRKVLLFIMDLN
jgi:hypothetical protein